MCCNMEDITYRVYIYIFVCACVRVCVCLYASISVSQQLDKNGTSPEATANTTDIDKDKNLKTCKEDVSGEYVKCKIVLSVYISLINNKTTSS